MALLQVAKLGDPILRQKAELVDLEFLNSQDNKLQVLIDDMIETMRKKMASVWQRLRYFSLYAWWLLSVHSTNDILKPRIFL